MRKRTIAILPTDPRDPSIRHPFRDALAAESRPNGRVASVKVFRGDAETVACSGDWAVVPAMAKVAYAMRLAAT